MAVTKTLLDELRSHSQVDCDTLDVEVAKALGPFVDCTSNQAIAFIELQKPQHDSLIKESVQLAKELHPIHASGATLEEIAVEIMMIKLSSKIVPHITGFAHIQTNPYHSYSVEATVTNAKRIISLYTHIFPTMPAQRICIKIPATWQGLQACQQLETQGIHTLATILFSMPQVVLATKVGCTYIAPYINELKVHFIPGYTDPNKGFETAKEAQAYYTQTTASTKVLPASLTSTAEVMKLAGAHHITVSPPLLAELASTPASATHTDLWFLQPRRETGIEVEVEEEEYKRYEEICKNEQLWQKEFKNGKGGADEGKLVDAVKIFREMQDGMVGIVGVYTS